MALYTRGGDRGETSLLDGSRVAKDDLRVAASILRSVSGNADFSI